MVPIFIRTGDSLSSGSGTVAAAIGRFATIDPTYPRPAATGPPLLPERWANGRTERLDKRPDETLRRPGLDRANRTPPTAGSDMPTDGAGGPAPAWVGKRQPLSRPGQAASTFCRIWCDSR